MDDCCDACKRFGGDAPEVMERPATALRARWERVKICVTGGRGATDFVPTGPQVTIGRGAMNDIVLPSGTLSRRQAVIVFEGDRVFAVDMKSGCGTYVDGRKQQRAELRAGSVVAFGDYELRVVPQ